MAQQNRRRARKGGPAKPHTGPGATGRDSEAAARSEERPFPEDRPFPELESGEEALAEAQSALGRPELAETPSTEELAAFEEQEAGRGPAAGGLSTRPVTRHRERDEVTHPAAVERAPAASLPARVVGFLQGSWRELQRVQWPDRRQVFQATGVVLGFVIVAGAFLGVASFAAQKIVNLILYGHG
ncbi:MAG TPA: preprotein translocase subunit SecE [Solirubrobacteraceae bacterium]|nr:preprotein translocase subunit SecE [Solirubrobacteraceae bacterium]